MENMHADTVYTPAALFLDQAWMANSLLQTAKNNLVEAHPCGY